MDTQVKVAIIGAFVTIIGYFFIYGSPIHPPVGIDPKESLPISWDFSDSLDGWERTGTALPWETLSDSVEWHQSWGDGVGVVVMDSCTQPLSDPPVKTSCGIKKTMYIPSKATRLLADILKIKEDGAITFKIIDSRGESTLGTEYLAGRQRKSVSYNLMPWAGRDVTLKIMSFGWGSGATASCSEDINGCCGEYIGLDKVDII